MRVKSKDWNNREHVVDLSDACTPARDYDNSGIAEGARAHAQKCAEAFGRLAALLAEKGVITGTEAISCSGNYLNEMELLP